eukprot:13588293-Ditylum_brightwellii.AAC.1
MTDANIGEDCRNTIESEAAVSASATAATQGRKMPAEIRHGLPHKGEKITEDGTTTSFNINSHAKKEHSINAYETKEQILELAEKDALYDEDGGDSDIECDENDLHHNSGIEEDKVPFDLDITETKGTAKKWSRPWLTEKPTAIKFDCPQFDDINNPDC